MKSQKNILQINGKNINICDFLKVLTPNNVNADFHVKIPITDYKHLGTVIFSLIDVCQTALYTFSENGNNEVGKGKMYGAYLMSIFEVLDIIKSLLPFSELELLKEISLATVNTTQNAND